MHNSGKVFFVVLAGCAIGLLLIVLVGQLEDSQARRLSAQADLERAETARARAESASFQERYILFVTSLALLTQGLDLLDVLLLGLAAAVGFLAAWLWKGGAAKL